MKLRSGSFSGRLLRRSKSKAKLEDTPTPVPELPALPTLPTVKLDAYLHLPFGNSSSSSSSTSPPSRALPAPPKKGLHRRSRSFSELLSIASSTLSHGQPWRSREAWAAIHSPSQEPIRKKPEGKVMDRTYGWIERGGDQHSSLYASGLGERDVVGRQEFKFFHNAQQKVPPSAIDSDDEEDDNEGEEDDPMNRVRLSHRDMRQPARSRLNESVTMNLSRDSTSSSSISTMDLSLNPHTPPTSFDNDFPLIHSHSGRHGGPHSATPSDESDLALPPLIPDLVKRAHSPPAFTGFPSPAPWAQRSPRKDIREASNLRWAHDDKTRSSSSTSNDTSPEVQAQPTRKPLNDRLAAAVVAARRGSAAQGHQRKRSTTLPSTFTHSQSSSTSTAVPSTGTVTGTGNGTGTDNEARPESGTLPEIAIAVVTAGPSANTTLSNGNDNTNNISNPPRPARHPRRLPPVPVLVHAPSPQQPGVISRSPDTSPSVYTPELISSPSTKGPSAYYRTSIPLKPAGPHQSLKASSRRPSTAPTPPSSSPLAFGARSQAQAQARAQAQAHGHGEQRQMTLSPSPNPSPLSSAFHNQRRSRQHSGTSSAERGGWI